MTGCILDRTSVSTLNETIRLSENKEELEGCIDHERQFKMAKRSQAPGDATVLKRFSRDNFVIFRRRSKIIAFLESVNFSACAYMQLFNFRDGHVTTFQHHSGAYRPICQIPAHRLPRLAKAHLRSIGFPSVPLVRVKLFPVL